MKTLLTLVCILLVSIGCKDTPSPVPAPAASPRSRPASEALEIADQLGETTTELGIAHKPSLQENVDPSDVALVDPDAGYEIRILSWNVESEGADANVISEELTQLNPNERYDVVGLTEVLSQDFAQYRLAVGERYQFASTKSGNNDRMQLLYNSDRFEAVRQFEIEDININGRYRAPLVVHLKTRQGDYEFLVVLNHLARGKAEIRQQQAKMLVEWARNETLPIVAIGDYNFDYVFETKQGNPAFNEMMRDNIWKWVQPEDWIDTNWYDNPQNPDGQDDYPGSMLDFAFVANAASEWTRVCRVIVRDNDFPDDKTTSDHRPFELLLKK